MKKTILTDKQKEKIQTVYLITEEHKIIPFGILDDIQPESKLTKENFKALFVLNDTLYEFTIGDFRRWHNTDFCINNKTWLNICRKDIPREVRELLNSAIRERED